jgi:hypothetical protein
LSLPGEEVIACELHGQRSADGACSKGGRGWCRHDS